MGGPDPDEHRQKSLLDVKEHLDNICDTKENDMEIGHLGGGQHAAEEPGEGGWQPPSSAYAGQSQDQGWEIQDDSLPQG